VHEISRKSHAKIGHQKVSRTGINGQNIAQISKSFPNGKDVAAQQNVSYNVQKTHK
jgi:hypothetical protein